MHLALLFMLWFGQQSINSATLGGRVVDPSGAPVPGIRVQATHTDRNQVFEMFTDERGRFRFGVLPLGEYSVRVEVKGFSPYARKLNLTVGQSVDLQVDLSIAGLEDAVDVTVDAPSIEAARTQLAETIIPREIDALPLNGRNYVDLALLLPGVSKTNTGNNERFAETSAIPGTGISVAGQRNLGNGFVVDGLSANDDAADLAGAFFSQEVIREFEAVTSGGVAEFGRASSGVINVVTQSGTNAWRAKLYGFFRNHRLDATNVFAPVDTSGMRIKTPLTQSQYGASVGGPLKHDRLFLFANLEREDLHRSGYITISPTNAAAINQVLDAVRYAPPRVVTGAYPTGDDRTSLFAKADYSLARHQISVRYSVYDISSPNARNVGSLNSISRGTIVADRDQTVAVNDVRTLSTKSANEFRFQYTRSRFAAPGNDLVGPAVNISGVANFGASTSSPTARDLDMIEGSDAYSVSRGSHVLKAGVDFIHNRVGIVFPAALYGTYTFSSLANFVSGNYTSFGQAFGKIDWLQNNPNLGWFVQDEWKLRSDLTINAGLRHDVEWLKTVHTQRHNFGPRLGIAYSPGRHQTVIRASVGQYFDRIPLRAIANAQRGSGIDYKTISLQRTQAGAPIFPDKLTSIPSGLLINLATIDTEIRNSYGLQANLQIEREVARRLTVSAGYTRMRGVHIIMNRNLNVPTKTAQQEPVNLGRPDPRYGNITQYSGQGDSYYDGLIVSGQYRGARWATARLSYTLSKAIDNTGNTFFSSPQDNFNLRDDRGLSDNDQRHRFTASGTFTLPRVQIQLNPILIFSSAYPFNVVTGGQTLQTTAARALGLGRNTGVGFNSAATDIRVSREFRFMEKRRIEIMLEAFNAFNRTNLQFPNNTYGAGSTPIPTFGRATNTSDPRQLQIGVRVTLGAS